MPNCPEVLQGFSAAWRLGAVIVPINYLIGENGSGKSTLLKLLCRLYSPDHGRITINGIDLASIRRNDLRSYVSIVFSDSLIFDGSIYDNILIGNLPATRDEVISAAAKAGLDDLVRALPGHYDTCVGESGHNLSSGEMQKIDGGDERECV